MNNFSIQLQHWYLANERILPWRQTRDPYKIWISEIILQQTQVIQGLSYFKEFVKTFPNLASLAKADIDDVLKKWEGLGYYSRARNLHATARLIMADFQGTFPNTYKDILQLKGIGPYTAAAIASFSYRLPHAVVDGNVYRFLSRLFAISTPVDSTHGKTQFSSLAHELLDTSKPDIHNQAIMEFGALMCTPTQPKCHICPFSSDCKAFNTGQISQFPVKTKKQKQRHRYFTYLLIGNKHSLFIEKRKHNDIWAGLYQFPLIESTKKTSLNNLLTDEWLIHHLKTTDFTLKKLNSYKHLLSHQIIHADFYQLNTKRSTAHLFGSDSPYVLIPKSDLGKFPFSQLIVKFLSNNKFHMYV